MLYERIALSWKKGVLLQKAHQGNTPVNPEEEIRDPYILRILGLPDPYSEKDLESALIQHLADFLLELGYGFTFRLLKQKGEYGKTRRQKMQLFVTGANGPPSRQARNGHMPASTSRPFKRIIRKL